MGLDILCTVWLKVLYRTHTCCTEYNYRRRCQLNALEKCSLISNYMIMWAGHCNISMRILLFNLELSILFRDGLNFGLQMKSQPQIINTFSGISVVCSMIGQHSPLPRQSGKGSTNVSFAFSFHYFGKCLQAIVLRNAVCKYWGCNQ